MKRLIALLTLLLPALLPAKPVDPADLVRAAQQVLRRSDVVDVTPSRFTECRLFAGSDGRGFVLLAADDCARPLLGYSLREAFPTDSIPLHVMAWIDGYQRVIAAHRAAGRAPAPAVAEAWRSLLDGSAAPKAAGSPVGPLLTTRWDQGTGYNDSCPYDSGARARCVTGCVATAGAQVLKYWNHPAVGRGSHAYQAGKYGELAVRFDTTHYDWAHMGNNGGSTAPMARRRASAQLIYHYGVAVDMDYSPSASGANSNPLGNTVRASSETALKEYFRYNPGLFTAYKEGFSDAAWHSLLDAELDASRPVLYDGYGPVGGHAFVLDGRDAQGLYHFNWGWGGNGNGFFTLDSLSPNDQMSFSILNSAIVRIYPVDIEGPTATLDVVSADPARGSVSGGGTFPTDSMRVLLLATAAPGYRFDHWTSGNPANPIITSPTADLADTAVFVPLDRDRVGYCRPNGIAYKNLTDSVRSEWGIRLPAERFAGKERLRQVQFWTYEASGPYLIRVYREAVPTTPLFSHSLTTTGYGMHTVDLPAGVDIPLDGDEPLWITVTADSLPFPISYSHYTGIDDGSLIKLDGQWQPIYHRLPLYGTWMIRAVMDPAFEVGVPAVADEPLEVSVAGRRVSVAAAPHATVALYDVQGRCLAAHKARLQFTVPLPGVYVVRCGAASRKVIVL